jgi:ABC-type nickel/cobalt efflux system permease component RcnA
LYFFFGVALLLIQHIIRKKFGKGGFIFMLALIELVGFVGLIVFGILAMVSAFRNKDPKNYMKWASIFFIILIAALIIDSKLQESSFALPNRQN